METQHPIRSVGVGLLDFTLLAKRIWLAPTISANILKDALQAMNS
jgi:hypothetical protein